ncbi:alginate export family protein [Novosphingobium nitrogenifigens]|nr:alginate export family protein [Novosphingobium nitrogenifigens]
MKYRWQALAATLAPVCLAGTAQAADAPKSFGDPITITDGTTIDPILDARLRFENVDTPTKGADALTFRARFGFEVKNAPSHLAFLAEGSGTTSIDGDYNGLSFIPAMANARYATVADPETIDLNRLQVQFRTKALGVTVGRQRINLDDQRWVGSSGWRQNEQTFDAARVEAGVGPVSIDATYAINQKTVFGSDAGPRRNYGGRFWFLGGTVKEGPFAVKGFAYLVDYNTEEQVPALAASLADTQTYGVRATAALSLTRKVKLNLIGSFARQSNYKQNPANYGVDYISGEGSLSYAGWTLDGGYELLGSDGKGHALQTPMATLHKFDGWADVFLTTPGNGLQDSYVGLSKALPKFKALPGLNAGFVWHRFDSDVGNLHYGNEWDASVGFRLGKVGLLAKYASFSASAPGFVDTTKYWLQAEYSF